MFWCLYFWLWTGIRLHNSWCKKFKFDNSLVVILGWAYNKSGKNKSRIQLLITLQHWSSIGAPRLTSLKNGIVFGTQFDDFVLENSFYFPFLWCSIFFILYNSINLESCGVMMNISTRSEYTFDYIFWIINHLGKNMPN